MFKLNKKGFTLIELLVVIAIIAVLASIVLVSLNTARVKGRDARRIADIKSIQNALALYYDNNNKYPANATGTQAGAKSALDTLVTAGVIPAIPDDPSTPSPATFEYYYATSSDGTTDATSYHLAAVMEGISASEGALATDADFASDALVYIRGFKGVSAACTTTTGTDKCYDVKN